MQLGNIFNGVRCGRCHDFLTIPATYRDGDWYHQDCINQALQLFANATRISNALSTIYVRIPEQQELL